MPNQRIFLWALLALVLWLNYQTWMNDYGAKPVATPAARTTDKDSSTAPPIAERGLTQSVPALPTAAEPAADGKTAAPNGATVQSGLAPAPAGDAPEVRVVTDVLDLDIGLAGGTLKRADLLHYLRQKNQPGSVVRLFEDSSGAPPYVLQSGLTTGAAGAQPDHLAQYSAPSHEYRLAEGQDELKVPLTWTGADGVTVVKTFTFKRGNYRIAVSYDVNNQSTAPVKAAPYAQLLRHQEHVERSMWNVETYAFKGPAVYDGVRYRKLDIEDDEDSHFNQKVTNGWLAALQHHFVAAVVPQAGEEYQYTLQVKDRDFLLSAVGPTKTVVPGSGQQFMQTVFVGPKLQNQLVDTGPELDRAADYGKLTILARPLFKLLGWVHGLVGNWGWAIIIVTALIKLLFYPLSETSGRSMAKMRNVAPRIKNIQERYKDNREQLGRAMMEIYKKEKINPAAGCLPMLVQIPVFLAFYWVLLESVEMRQAPFMLWINDLSSKDPWFVLPILMGGAMFAQFKLNPAPPDPMQAKVFMIMPFVMTVMFAFFPSGLVLYWLTNTLLSIAQQWNINRRIATAAAKKN